MAAHSSILAWRIPWTEEPGGLQSMGSQTVLATHTHILSVSSQMECKLCWGMNFIWLVHGVVPGTLRLDERRGIFQENM